MAAAAPATAAAEYQINPIALKRIDGRGRSAAASAAATAAAAVPLRLCEDRVDPFLHFYGSPISHLCTPRTARARLQFQ